MNKSTTIQIIIIILLTLILGILVKITLDAMNNQEMQKPSVQEQMGNNANQITYSAIEQITNSTIIESGSYISQTADENAILVNGDIDVTLSNVEVEKTGGSDGGDNTSFYGTNSGILAKDGANLILKNVTVTTNATGANGVFSYGRSSYNKQFF